MTNIIKISSRRPQRGAINLACKVLKQGGVIIFPTETVYGLGASPFRKSAIKRIFRMKGRSLNNPMAVLVSKMSQVRPLVKNITPKAMELMRKHWPGALTLIFEKSGKIPAYVTSGRKTIGIRMPSHKVALKLVEKCGIPLVATSANLSGLKPSKTAGEALDSIKDADLILDGGPSRIGAASTVVDVTGELAKILRRGTLKVRI